MTTAVLEIVELGDGEVALRRADGEGEDLVTIQFSDEAVAYLRDAHVDIARAMINTGIQIVGKMTEELVKSDDELEASEIEAAEQTYLH